MKRRPGNIMVTVKLPPAQAEILRQVIKTEKFEYSVEDARLIESHILLEDSSTLQDEATLTTEKKRTIVLLGEQTAPIPARSIHTCRFSPEHIEDTLESYNLFSASETCPHIRMVQVGGIIFYAVMDSNCHTPQPDLQSNECDKEPSQLIRLIVKKDFRSRGSKPVKITAILKSHKPHLLAFSDGVLDEFTNVLDLTNKPLCVGPIYKKVGRSNQDIINIRVISFPQHELERIPVEIEVTVWKEHPYDAYQRKCIILSVAVPPIAAPPDVVP